MRIIHSLANSVKISIGPKRVLLLAAIAAGIAVAALLASRFVVQRSSAHGVDAAKPKQQGCCRNVPATLRRMIGTYYTTEDDFKSTLVLNNKGPNQIVVTPILHNQNGQTFNGLPVAVGGQSSYEVDLNAVAASAGREFRSGSFEFTYTGRLLEMGGGLRIVDSEKSLIFDEQMLEPGMKFSSPQLEAVYASPFESARVSVIVTNTTAGPLFVNGNAIFAGEKNQRPLQGQLRPYETQVIKLPHGQTKEANAGAVSLNHNGGKGALMAMIHVQDPDRGYSESVNFSDPAQGKTNQLHGAGLRLGSVNGDSLNSVIVVRNIGKDATAVTANVPYSKQDGKTGKISLPQLSLAPGEIKLFDTSNPQLRQKDFATAGLEIEYKGAPGSVIATASSVSQSGNQVFALPLKDPQGGLSSTGGYPWFIKETSSTVVFIKNVTNEIQEYILSVIYSGGRWGANIQTLAPGQTVAFDVRKIRDSQQKGSEGNVVPLDTRSGHISWSLRGNRNKVLIGRAQTVDFNNGLASTYECQCLCNASWGNETRITPGSVAGFPDDVQVFQIQTRYNDCHGNEVGWYTLSNYFLNNYVTYSSDNPSVATFTAPATGTALAPGSANLEAKWTEYYQDFDDTYGICFPIAAAAACAAFCDVADCTRPTGEETNTYEWANAPERTKHLWIMRLKPFTPPPNGSQFSGRIVTEQDPTGGGPDTCWFQGSERAKFEAVIGGMWQVDNSNAWKYDKIGWSEDAVAYYRSSSVGRAPCGTKFMQRMVINCPGSALLTRPYVTNELKADIGTTTVSSSRAGITITKTYQ
ncbi:MAG: hypothetical protein ACRENT_01690 [Thermodesulfobacteriota bacterium]